MSESIPDAVRIDDLLDPVHPPEVAAAFEAMAPLAEAVDFSTDAVLTQAAADTGLDDLGDDVDLVSLGVLTAALAGEAPLSTLGRLSVFDNLVASARNRLLAVDLLKRHPEIHDIEIAGPIIIAGQARTGTTHLHNLLSADPSLSSLSYWESIEPVPPLDEQRSNTDPDPRYVRCAESLAGLNAALPLFRRMHDMYPEHVHEEIQLANNAFSSMLFETMSVVPSWRDHYLSTDQTPYYEFIKTMLKVITFVRARRTGTAIDVAKRQRWVLKSPAHVEQFGPLVSVFPDATFVRTHRDPLSISASMATMLCYTGRMSQLPEAMPAVGRYWIERAESMFHAAVDQRDIVAAERVVDVRFHEFMADDVATVEKIYEVARQPFTPEVRTAMDQFMVDHPRGKHGRILYDIADFGFDQAERRRALQFYVDAFGLEIEGSAQS